MEEFFLKNPWVRSFVPLLLMSASSVFASSLVVELADGNSIQWSEIPKKVSFYILLISTVLLCVYQVAMARHDQNLVKGLTNKQYDAAHRSKILDEHAKRSKKLIKEGKITQLEEETEVFKKLFGEEVK